jgi:hypothetical protein
MDLCKDVSIAQAIIIVGGMALSALFCGYC